MNVTLSYHFNSFDDQRYKEYINELEINKERMIIKSDILSRWQLCEKSLDLVSYLIVFVRNVTRMAEEAEYQNYDSQRERLYEIYDFFMNSKENLLEEIFEAGRENELSQYQYVIKNLKRIIDNKNINREIIEASYGILDKYQKELNGDTEALSDVFEIFYNEKTTEVRERILKDRLYPIKNKCSRFDEMYKEIKKSQLAYTEACGYSNPRYYIDDEYNISHNAINYLEDILERYKWSDLFIESNNIMLDMLYPQAIDIGFFSFQEAMKLVAKCFGEIFPQMGEMIERAYECNWIDWEERKGKLIGCYTNTIHYTGESLISMTYLGALNDLCKLAHELGHAYHGYLLSKEPYSDADYSILAAEIFGIFCENYVLVYLAKNSKLKKEIMSYFRNTIVSILLGNTVNFMFEKNVFSTLKISDEFSVSTIFYDVLSDIFGKENVNKNSGYELMWISRVQNFFPENFYYNFVYVIGEFVSIELIRKIINEEIVGEKIESFLSCSGIYAVNDLIHNLEIDLSEERMFDINKQYIDICGLLDMYNQ